MPAVGVGPVPAAPGPVPAAPGPAPTGPVVGSGPGSTIVLSPAGIVTTTPVAV